MGSSGRYPSGAPRENERQEVKGQNQNLKRSLGNAFVGLWAVWRTQRNARIEAAIALAVVVVGLFLGLPIRDWAVLALTIGLVLAAECLNTAIEALVDLVSPDYHELAKLAKDASAGAVLLLSFTAVIIGLLLLGPPLARRLF